MFKSYVLQMMVGCPECGTVLPGNMSKDGAVKTRCPQCGRPRICTMNLDTSGAEERTTAEKRSLSGGAAKRKPPTITVDLKARTITSPDGPDVHLKNDSILFFDAINMARKWPENSGALPFDHPIMDKTAKQLRESLVRDFEAVERPAKDVKRVVRTRRGKGCEGYVLAPGVKLKGALPTGEVPFAPGVTPETAESREYQRKVGEPDHCREVRRKSGRDPD